MQLTWFLQSRLREQHLQVKSARLIQCWRGPSGSEKLVKWKVHITSIDWFMAHSDAPLAQKAFSPHPSDPLHSLPAPPATGVWVEEPGDGVKSRNIKDLWMDPHAGHMACLDKAFFTFQIFFSSHSLIHSWRRVRLQMLLFNTRRSFKLPFTYICSYVSCV